ncbi:MAG: TIGR02186 family protein, partial [Euryarchaeota archaeon]|nr:TIGR02186 family protein [Euryarchaeota archaeon]
YEAVLQIPPTASVGMDMVDIYVVKGGVILEHQRKVLTIENAGIGGWLTEMAEERGLLYGFIAVIVALSAGLVVGVMFKGGGGH